MATSRIRVVDCELFEDRKGVSFILEYSRMSMPNTVPCTQETLTTIVKQNGNQWIPIIIISNTC